ncbi:MAG: hypothetical protein MUE50_11595 [Pirellulaceae bacterium]|jgi:chemotaxis protein histidine kinase CheA|nr:hypothetical protein [Pirellulaceae bacterium]
MRLEKATFHSGEAGLAGWISSNDVTLFTVVMVVVVAIFLQASLVKRAKLNTELEGEKLSLSDQNRRIQEEVRRVSAELAAINTQLADTRNTLGTTQRERQSLEEIRKQLDLELAAKKQELQQRSDELAKLNTAKTAVETQLQQRQKERDDLQTSRDDLQKERDLLDQQVKALAERVAKLEQQLGASEKSLAELKQTSDAKSQSLEELLARALERQKTDQTASAQQLQAVMTQAEQAAAQAKEAAATRDDYLDRLRRAAVYVRDADEKQSLLALQVEALKTQLANALDDLKTAQSQLQTQRTREASINRELVGLRGGLKRVAILFDASGSMTQDGRWNEVQRIALTWLDHLDVDECVLIVFSSDVAAFPTNGTLLRVSGAEGAANRAQLLQYLKAVKPEGWTNTLPAMQLAYRYPVDTIILFSDGAPTYEKANRFNAEAVEQIYALCRQHADIPVNAIGLGNYFDQNFSTFLRTVAQLSGGTFVGR